MDTRGRLARQRKGPASRGREMLLLTREGGSLGCPCVGQAADPSGTEVEIWQVEKRKGHLGQRQECEQRAGKENALGMHTHSLPVTSGNGVTPRYFGLSTETSTYLCTQKKSNY